MSTTGIGSFNSRGITVDGANFDGLDVGVEVVNGDCIIKGSEFNDVVTAVKGLGKTSIEASNLTHTEPQWGGEPTPLEIVRRFANAYV